MINLAFAKLSGATDAGAVYIPAIDDTVFATPSLYTGTAKESVRLACMRYEHCLRQALIDIQPKFARKYADLGLEIEITLAGASALVFERADWYYMFDLPSDFLDLIAQVDEGDKLTKQEAQIITAHSFAHIVEGTDDKSYYCSTAHTSEAANKPITGGSYAAKWTLFSADGGYGAEWETGKAYKSAQTGKLLLTNEYSNEDGDSAYIEYLGYVRGGFADVPTYYDQHFIEAFVTLLASELAPWSKGGGVRAAFKQEYLSLAKHEAQARDVKPDYEKPVTTWLNARSK